MASNEIWVLAEIRGGRVTRGTFQLMGAARDLSARSGGKALFVLAGGDEAASSALAGFAPVVKLDSPRLEPYEATRHAAALADLASKRGAPIAVLAGATSTGLELAPRLAALLGCGYASSCVAIGFDNGAVTARRPVHGGRVYEEIAFGTAPACLTARPGSFAMPERLAAPGTVEKIALALPDALGFAVVERKATAAGRQDVSEARRVVTGGRGMGDAARFKMIEELAEVLDAAVGASRALVDAGFRPHDEQVGKSGKTVSPELYVAVGVSGAIHHTLGMNTSKVVVAVNTDPEALIFKSADYGIVGDGAQVVPALAAALRKIEKKA
ncbi:MAG: electron transfer flavoprotein subunit alpha/FixB family protein [Deltaproteobacteria bacterium]|nr:electron transfer flavoprotein subunit alpha/FixB family protein [Deltaproteobacteria bacterium]